MIFIFVHYLVVFFIWESCLSNTILVVCHSLFLALQTCVSGFWDNKVEVRALMQNKVAFVVGNGRRVKFWKDIWWGNLALCNSFPSLYAFASSKEAWVEEFWDTLGVEGAWSPRFSRPFNDWEVEEWRGFF